MVDDVTVDMVYPFREDAVRALKVGTIVRVSGVVYTGRDRLHKYLAEGGRVPVELRDGAMFHCGPVMLREPSGAWRTVAAGPTTSIREEPYMAQVIERFGVRLIIGKGGMGAATREACQRYGCVYLQTAGGAAALLAQRIKKVRGVHFLAEFGATEALWELEAEGIAAVVGIDAHGQSLYDEVSRTSHAQLAALLAR